MHDLTFALSVFTGMIAMMNPIANIPVFLSLVENYPIAKKREMILRACIVAICILLGFIVLGKFIFSIFGITIPAFKITGGILIFKIGFDMLQSRTSRVNHISQSSENKDVDIDEGIAISPLAIPLLAGPGAIVTAMNFVSDSSYIHLIIVILISALVIGINYILLRSGDVVVDKLGKNVMTVLTKLMGLILAIMGTGMVIEGISALPIFAR